MIDIIENLPAFFSLIIVTVSIVIGVKIIQKFFKYRDRTFIFVGIAWIGLISPWVPDVIRLIVIIMEIPASKDSMILIYFIFIVTILPISFLFWLTAITNLMEMQNPKQTFILVFTLVMVIIFEFIFVYLFLTDLSMIGTFRGAQSREWDFKFIFVEWSLLVNLFLLICVAVFLISGIIFALKTLMANKREVKLKGKLLLIGFISTSIGATIEVMLTTIVFDIFARSILAISSIIFYMGFILPERVKNYFLK